MIPVIHASPSLARSLAKALCSPKLYYVTTVLCVLLGAIRCPGRQLYTTDLSYLIAGRHDFPVLFLEVGLSLLFMFLATFSSPSFNALFVMPSGLGIPM